MLAVTLKETEELVSTLVDQGKHGRAAEVLSIENQIRELVLQTDEI